MHACSLVTHGTSRPETCLCGSLVRQSDQVQLWTEEGCCSSLLGFRAQQQRPPHYRFQSHIMFFKSSRSLQTAARAQLGGLIPRTSHPLKMPSVNESRSHALQNRPRVVRQKPIQRSLDPLSFGSQHTVVHHHLVGRAPLRYAHRKLTNSIVDPS